MPTIALGSQSEDKKKMLTTSLKLLYPEKTWSIDLCKVSSSVSKQPMNEAETIRGSINRALNAINKCKNAEIGVGIEFGFQEISNQGYFLVCSCSIADSDSQIFTGVSGKIRIPQSVSMDIKQHKDFTEVMHEYRQRNLSPEVAKLISRILLGKLEITDAIERAFSSFMVGNIYTGLE